MVMRGTQCARLQPRKRDNSAPSDSERQALDTRVDVQGAQSVPRLEA